jgi:hypothetical protein
MLGMSLVDKFKSLDVYRKLPKDIAQPTYSGAMCKNFINIVSLISTGIMCFLLFNEYLSYIKVKINSEMFIDVNRGGDKVVYY